MTDMFNADDVVIGSIWLGGTLPLKILAVDGDHCLFGYAADPEDCTWELREHVAQAFQRRGTPQKLNAEQQAVADRELAGRG